MWNVQQFMISSTKSVQIFVIHTKKILTVNTWFETWNRHENVNVILTSSSSMPKHRRLLSPLDLSSPRKAEPEDFVISWISYLSASLRFFTLYHNKWARKAIRSVQNLTAAFAIRYCWFNLASNLFIQWTRGKPAIYMYFVHIEIHSCNEGLGSTRDHQQTNRE